MRALVLSLLIMALLHAFQPYFSDSVAQTPSRSDVEALSVKSRLITAEGVESYLTNAKKPTMLVVYASWCQYCRRLMPNVNALWHENKIPGDQMLLLSVDENVSKLSEYLLSSRFDQMVGTPILLKNAKNAGLRDRLNKMGTDFSGGIPYIAFFGTGGKLRYELSGAVSKADIEQALVHLK